MPHRSTPATPGKLRGDHALIGILASNALTLAIALWQQWSLPDLMWPFLIQSLVIGWYARRRMMLAPRITAENFHINGVRVTDPAVSAVVLFMALKTAADLGAHVLEHWLLGRPPKSRTGGTPPGA